MGKDQKKKKKKKIEKAKTEVNTKSHIKDGLFNDKLKNCKKKEI
jgi:guanylate kinase